MILTPERPAKDGEAISKERGVSYRNPRGKAKGLWLAGTQVRHEVLDILPLVAATRDPEILNYLVHAIEKIISVRRYGDTPEEVRSSLVQCLRIMVDTPQASHWHRPSRAKVALDVVTGKLLSPKGIGQFEIYR